jgi:hypothetical protein
MKSALLYLSFSLIIVSSFAQPIALRSDIQIKAFMPAQLFSIRIMRNPSSQNLYYNTSEGNIYKIIIPDTSPAYDTLMYTKSDHGIEYVQGFVFFGNTIYLLGNNEKDSSLTTGKIMKGILQGDGSRTWTTIATTVPYPTSWKYYHLLSGMTINPTGDTLMICSGARSDHGEIQDRNGDFPGVREISLTSLILSIPTSSQNIVLQNDSTWLANNKYVYAYGVRNTFDMAYSADGNLFGTENSGDRDQPDELNWLRKGHHYGFPWVMGGLDNPQQTSPFTPSNDLLINQGCLSFTQGYFCDDPAFPQKPAGLTLTSPVRNYGPDADKFRDQNTGKVKDASDENTYISSFTSHRAPGGLNFDNAGAVGGEMTGGAFMISWTPGGDSLGNTAAGNVGPFCDAGEDLVHIKLIYNTATDNYDANVTKIVEGFKGPVDSEIIDNKIYVLEYGYMGTPMIWEVTLPAIIQVNTGIPGKAGSLKSTIFPNPCTNTANISLNADQGSAEISVYNSQGTRVKNMLHEVSGPGNQQIEIDIQELNGGVYFYTVTINNSLCGGKIIVAR